MSSNPKISGTLKNWNPDKGFGFITPANGGQDIFVHISDYPRAGGPPDVGEPLLFQITLNKDGKKKATNVNRPGQSSAKTGASAPRQRPHKEGPTFIGRLMAGALMLVIAGAGYKYVLPRLTDADTAPLGLTDTGPTSSSALSTAKSATMAPSPSYQCDGRRFCSQMTSCGEAKYFLQNCPNTEMDGDHDGTPCESQWCTSPFAR